MWKLCQQLVSGTVAIALVVLFPSPMGRVETGIHDGDWVGSFQLPASAALVRVDLQLHGARAVVALGAGHASDQTVAVRRSATVVRFALPGSPAPMVFVLHLHAPDLSGSVTQGQVRGTARLAPTVPSLTRFLGTYRLPDGNTLTISDLRRLGVPPWLEDIGTDDLRGLYRLNSTRYAIGEGESTRDPVAGRLDFAHDGSSLREVIPGKGSVRAVRVPFRQEEVRFRSGGVTIAATLTLPLGNGPFAAAVMVHGAGPSQRDENQMFVGFLAAHGIAALAMDKRGQGQSAGRYPGDLATETAVRTYAADAEAGGRFLAARTEIDHGRIGLFGGSQAGWIIPLAATEVTPLFTFAVILSGPVVSQGESDYYAELTDRGNSLPTLTPDEIDARVRANGPSGFEPRPLVRALHIPILWIYGDKDQTQPTRLDLQVLEEIKSATGADFTWTVFKNSGHGLDRTPNGLNSEAAKSPGFASGFFAAMEGWLHTHSLGN